MASKKVFVTGATGQQGGALARLLLERGHAVRALVRKPESAAAAALRQAGAELVGGDMEDEVALTKAVENCESVFCVTTPFEAGMDAEVRQGLAVANAAHRAGSHLVFTSVMLADTRTGIPHFDSKGQVEEHIRQTGVSHTIIGPAYFMENVLAPWAVEALRGGTLAVPMIEGLRLPQVAVADIARFAVFAIEQPERVRGVRVDIAGDSVTGRECAEIISRASGRTVAYFAVPIEAVRSQSEDLGIMFQYYEDHQPVIDTEALRRDYPEVNWTGYPAWAHQQDWDRVFAQT